MSNERAIINHRRTGLRIYSNIELVMNNYIYLTCYSTNKVIGHQDLKYVKVVKAIANVKLVTQFNIFLLKRTLA